MLSDSSRDLFDSLLEREIEVLPDQLKELLEEVPLIVEDYPSEALLHDLEMGPSDRMSLCGLHWGVALSRRSVEAGTRMPDRMMLFREPIMQLAAVKSGRPGASARRAALQKQIHITLLHEIGHHFGLDEDDLDRLGYG